VKQKVNTPPALGDKKSGNGGGGLPNEQFGHKQTIPPTFARSADEGRRT